MANPNVVNVVSLSVNTTYAALTTNSNFYILSNPSNSGQVLKVDSFKITNINSASYSATVSFNSGAAGSGTNYRLTYGLAVPVNGTLTVADKSTPIYLQENTSLIAFASANTALEAVLSYEILS